VLRSGADPYVPIGGKSQIDCPPEVFAAIDRGLKLAISDRPQSIAEFVALLGWRGDATPARPDPKPAMASRPAARDAAAPANIATVAFAQPAAPAKPAAQSSAEPDIPQPSLKTRLTVLALVVASLILVLGFFTVLSRGRDPQKSSTNRDQW